MLKSMVIIKLILLIKKSFIFKGEIMVGLEWWEMLILIKFINKIILFRWLLNGYLIVELWLLKGLIIKTILISIISWFIIINFIHKIIIIIHFKLQIYILRFKSYFLFFIFIIYVNLLLKHLVLRVLRIKELVQCWVNVRLELLVSYLLIDIFNKWFLWIYKLRLNVVILFFI